MQHMSREDWYAAGVDRGATMANFSQTKGEFPYKKDTHLTNCLKSIIAGSISCGDRLHAAGLLDSDLCTCQECNGARHTTHHVFWECHRHKTIRDKYLKQFKEIFDSIKKVEGTAGLDELASTFNNITFQHTGICPDSQQAIEEANKANHQAQHFIILES